MRHLNSSFQSATGQWQYERVKFGVQEETGSTSRVPRAVTSGRRQGTDRGQHSKGKLTARERPDLLLDPGTFVETDRFAMSQSRNLGSEDKRILGDGVVTGHGTIDAGPSTLSHMISPFWAVLWAKLSQ